MVAPAPKSYTVSDGQLVLTLTPDPSGGFVVTSPMDPELITQAETLDEAFELAHEVRQELAESREKLFEQLQPTSGS